MKPGFLLFLLFYSATLSASQAGNDHGAIRHLSRDIPPLMHKANIPGMGVALIRHGELVWSKGFGVANADMQDPVTSETVFECNSLTKPVFAYAVMRLVDERKFDLDRPLVTYMPATWRVSRDVRFSRVNARQILSHSSGLKEIDDNQLGFVFDPGSRWKYAPTGYELLGKVVEHVTGMSVQQFMEIYALRPLQMTSSNFIWQSSYERLHVFRHDWLGKVDGKPIRWQHGAPCCSLQATVNDYAKFVLAAMDGKGLSASSNAEMRRPQIQASDKFPDIAWGIGWGLEMHDGRTSLWHWGDGGTSKDFVAVDLQQRNALIVMSNSENGLFFVRELLRDALGGVHDAPAFLEIEGFDSPSWLALQDVLDHDSSVFLKSYEKFHLSEEQMNTLGNRLTQAGHLVDATAVLRQNTIKSPESTSAWDNYAGALERQGDLAGAGKAYKHSLDLDSNDRRAADWLIKHPQSPVNQ